MTNPQDVLAGLPSIQDAALGTKMAINDAEAGVQDVANTAKAGYNASPLSSEAGAVGTDVKNLSRDMRFKQGNPEFKPNVNPEAPMYSSTQDTPASGFTKEELAKNNAELPPITSEKPFTPVSKITPERTFTPDNPTKTDILANQKRNIQIDGTDIKSPNDVNQVNATLNGYKINGSLTDQAQAVNNKIGELSDQAKTIISNQGGAISKSDLVNQTAHNLTYSQEYQLGTSQAKNQATLYLD